MQKYRINLSDLSQCNSSNLQSAYNESIYCGRLFCKARIITTVNHNLIVSATTIYSRISNLNNDVKGTATERNLSVQKLLIFSREIFSSNVVTGITIHDDIRKKAGYSTGRFLCSAPANTTQDYNAGVVDGDRCRWAWSTEWRAWLSRPFLGLEEALDSSAREVSVGVSARLSPSLRLEVAVPKPHASLSLQS